MINTIKRFSRHDFIKYGMVGALSTVLDFAVFNLSYKMLGNNMSHLWLATAAGFVFGTVNGYIFNSRWTFSYNTKGQELKKFIQFLIVSIIGLLFTELIVLSLANMISLDKNIAKGAAVIVVFFWNYFANKFWTFKK